MAAVESAHAPTSCPYCESRFENKEELSKHIDIIHLSGDLMRAILDNSKFSP